MSEQLDRLGIEYEFLDAVRGADAVGDPSLYDPRAALTAEGRELRPGEVGCALSHTKAYAEIAGRGLACALVLEDDAILHPDLPAVLRKLERKMLEQGEIIFLERCDYVRPGSSRAVLGQYRLARPILVRAGSTAQAAGYVVTGSAAEAIKALNIPVSFPADSWGHYIGFVRFRGIQPTLTLVRQNTGFGSATLEEGTRNEFKKYPLWRLIAHDFLFYTAVGRIAFRALKASLKR